MNPEFWANQCFFIVVLIAMQVSDVISQIRKPKCNAIMQEEKEDMWTNVASFTSLLHHVFPTGCFLCSRPTCDFYTESCVEKASTLGKIPIYYNILEFGLSGTYFPSKATISIYINEDCYFNLTIEKISKTIEIDIFECYTDSNSCRDLKQFNISLADNLEYQFCLFFGLALYEINKLHYILSSSCNVFMSAFFNESQYNEVIDKQRCTFNKSQDKPEVEYSFVQPNDRNLDGVPVILPCSPGGFVVDPFRGRYVIGEPCWQMFGERKEEGVGLNFILKNIYGNDENLLFPNEYNRTNKKFKPMYIWHTGSALPRKQMETIHLLNILMLKKKRVVCEYEDLEPTSVIPPVSKKTQCKEFISSVTQNIPEDVEKENEQEEMEVINAYIHNSTGCLICANLGSHNISTVTIPVYYDLFEFGFSGQFFPKSALVIISISAVCDLEIEIFQEADNVITIRMYECQLKKPNCTLLPVLGYTDTILFYNWYCVHIGLAFHHPQRIYYGFSFRCDKFAGSKFNDSIFVNLKNKVCFNSGDNKFAIFELKQADNSTVDGVPIIVPCSSGGYAVDPATGELAVNQTCDDMFWETLVNKTSLSGIHFIIKNMFDNNEDLLFRKRGPNIPYPRPLYMNENGRAMPPSEVLPTVVDNEDRKKMFREKCLLRREASAGTTTTTSSGASSAVSTSTPTPTMTTATTGTGTATTATRPTEVTTTMTSASSSEESGTAASEGNTISSFMSNEIAILYLTILRLEEIF